MDLRIPILSMLGMGMLAFADDYSNSVKALQKSQSALDQMIAPYKARSGFQQESIFPTNEEKKKSIINLHNSPSRLQASLGKLLFGTTVNRLVVGSETSPTIIELKSGQGSFSNLRMIATASQSSTPGRLSIQVQKVVFRSGTAQAIQGIILDKDGAQGVEAQVISQKALSIAGALGSSFISGLAASEQSVSSNAFGFESTQRSARNSILGGLAQTAADQSKRFIEEATSEKPVLILEPGTKVSIFLQEEVKF